MQFIGHDSPSRVLPVPLLGLQPPQCPHRSRPRRQRQRGPQALNKRANHGLSVKSVMAPLHRLNAPQNHWEDCEALRRKESCWVLMHALQTSASLDKLMTIWGVGMCHSVLV